MFNVSDEYGAESIQVLEGLTAVRTRPSMYIGTVGKAGLHHLVYELVDNAVDEALGGYCTSVKVTLHRDNSVSVVDNGRGIPVEPHPRYDNIPAIEVIMTKLHSGGKFDNAAYKVSGGLHGVGLSVVNALSEWMYIDVYRGGQHYRQRYERGDKASDLSSEPDQTGNKGSSFSFKPDAEIFEETTEYEYDTIRKRLRETAYLTKGLEIILEDNRVDPVRQERFFFEGGIQEWVHDLNLTSGKELLTPQPIFVEGEKEEVMVEVAVGYNNGFNKQNVFCFANNINTREGGTHLTGFRHALLLAIKNYQKRMAESKPRSSKRSSKRAAKKKENDEVQIEGEDVKEGLVAVISVKLKNPQFEAQTKVRLTNAHVRTAVSTITYEQLTHFFEQNPKVAEAVVAKAMLAAEIRVKTKKVRDQARKKTVRPENYVPCRTNNPDDAEIFIVEGRSAGGSAKSGRDPRTQAILMLRGKVINVEKNSMIKVLDNREIQSMISVLGTDIDEAFDISKLKYKKVIIMTDADIDGAHIRTLLLTFFFRHMQEIVEAGNLYIAQPPLFSISKKRGQKTYFYSEEKLEEYQREHPNDKGHLQRYKGLGEMNAQELSETTMNPDTRLMWQVTIEQSLEASKLFTILMGENVEARRDFIMEHAKDEAIEIDV